MLFTLCLTPGSSAAHFLFVIYQSFQMSSSTHWKNARVTTVVGKTERCMSRSSTCPFSELAIREAQWLTELLSTALTPYTFFNCLWLFVTYSFSATRNSIKACCFKCTKLYHAMLMSPCTFAIKCIIPEHCSSKWGIENQPQKKLWTFPVDFDWRTEGAAKLFWAILVFY